MKGSARWFLASMAAAFAATGAAVAQADDIVLTDVEKVAVQHTLNHNWAWEAQRAAEDQQRLMDETLPALEAAMATQQQTIADTEARMQAAQAEQAAAEAQAVRARGAPGFEAAAAALALGLALVAARRRDG